MDAFCQEHNIIFYNPGFKKYQKNYPNLKLLKLPLIASKLIWFIKKAKSLFNKNHIIDFNDSEIVKKYLNNPQLLKWRMVYCHGWNFRSPLVRKYRDEYKKQFTLTPTPNEITRKFLQKSPEIYNVLGVHIRRGDYEQYAGGMFFYDDKTYIQFIKEALTLIGSNTRIVLFSNDNELDFECYKKEFNNVMLSKSSVAEDHYLMSCCDFLIGTFSTFSLWASYIGQAKLYHIMQRTDKIGSILDFEETNELNYPRLIELREKIGLK